ncbi:MAG: bifunctional DNA-formamidopyrimidine glycosylase/DNA-(apurinic or apyrimidinic site) lyase [Candidatus Krumholzibacteriia bacterium]
MPELPEVESVAQALRHNLAGRRCTGLTVRFGGILAPSPAAVRHAMQGRVLQTVERHGKYLVLGFRDPGPSRVMLHLRMTGQVFVLDGYRPDKHVHLSLDFDGLPVHYRDIRKFGRWQVVGPDWRERELAHIGPDMLDVRFAEWYERVRRRRAPLKSVLLDQGVAAGLGNIYVDEALFRAGVHPLAQPADLSREELQRVLKEAKGVLRLAIRHGGTTFLNFTDFHGQPGNFRRKLRVYGRAGEACPRCGGEIRRLVIGGRSSCFCADCQKLSRRTS